MVEAVKTQTGEAQDRHIKGAILRVIQQYKGEEHRIKAKHLCVEVNKIIAPQRISPRVLRMHLAELRVTEAGCFICSSYEGGYFWEDDLLKLKDHLIGRKSHALSILGVVSGQLRAAKIEDSGQQAMF